MLRGADDVSGFGSHDDRLALPTTHHPFDAVCSDASLMLRVYHIPYG
jgi:hypothetical protein